MALTIQQAIDKITGAIPGMTRPKTVDTVTLGDPSQPVTGIISTFVASQAVIEQSIAYGANLIISHETIFYNHQDEIDWLRDNPVYLSKRRLIEERNLVIWRFHDYLHTMRPDPTVIGLIDALEWDSYPLFDQPDFCQIPPVPLRQLVDHLKAKLGIDHVRFIGDPRLICRRVGLLPGFGGRERQIQMLNHPDIDVLIGGEIHEWETGEYVRDAVHFGHRKALIIPGHAASEEAGMKWVAGWLQTLLPGVPVHFLPTGSLFRWL